MRMSRSTRLNGFTIVEVLVVILLISLLAAFIVPQYIGRAEEAKRQVTRARIALLENAVMMLYRDTGKYPQSSEGLAALVEPPQSMAGQWKGPYCKPSQIIDDWGNPFVYTCPGQKNPRSFDITSYGRDGRLGGEGDDADIVND